MAEKLVMLCAEVIAKDCSETGHFRLRTLLESILPTSVLLVALSSVPLNQLIQLEEDFPEHFTVIRKQWKELCKKCAKKHFPFREKFQRALENLDDRLGYKALLLNAYFQEVLDACSVAATTVRRSAKVPRVSSRYILQGSLGQSRHNVSDEKMLIVLAEHITELTLSSKYILQLRQLIQVNNNCMRRLKTLKLDTCTPMYTPYIHPHTPHLYTPMFTPLYTSCFRTRDWTYCVKHILQRSPIQTLSITSCCTILNKILCLWVKGRQVDEAKSSLWNDAILGLESDVNGSHDSEEVSDFGLYDNMTGEEAASEHLGIKELSVLKCSKVHHDTKSRQRAYCSGLERLNSLERLTVSCKSQMKLTDKFLCAITKLLKCGSSQLKYLCIDGAVWDVKQIMELGQCLNAANDLKKEIIITDWILKESSVPTDDEQALVSCNCLKFSKSTISSLIFSHELMDYTVDTVESEFEWFKSVPLFTVFLKVYNPEYFNICCDHEPLAFPNHSLQDVPTNSEGLNLRKLTVVPVLNFCNYLAYVPTIHPLHAMLQTVNLILKELSKEVDVHIFYQGRKPSDIYNSLFKTVEMKPLDKRY